MGKPVPLPVAVRLLFWLMVVFAVELVVLAVAVVWLSIR